MFSSSDELGAAREAITYNAELDAASRFRAFASQSRRIEGIDVSALPQGTEVVVDTRNSRYRLVVLDGWRGHALVEGGRYFRSRDHSADRGFNSWRQSAEDWLDSCGFVP